MRGLFLVPVPMQCLLIGARPMSGASQWSYTLIDNDSHRIHDLDYGTARGDRGVNNVRPGGQIPRRFCVERAPPKRLHASSCCRVAHSEGGRRGGGPRRNRGADTRWFHLHCDHSGSRSEGWRTGDLKIYNDWVPPVVCEDVGQVRNSLLKE